MAHNTTFYYYILLCVIICGNVMCYKQNYSKIQYTKAHRKAFCTVEKQLLGHNTFRSLFHDADKLVLLCIVPKDKASMLHRKYSRHHEKTHTTNDYIQMVVGWECARVTLYKYYTHMISVIEPLLIQLGL